MAHATTKLTLANLVYNLRRLAWIESRTAPGMKIKPEGTRRDE
jgi:hypothetical protein